MYREYLETYKRPLVELGVTSLLILAVLKAKRDSKRTTSTQTGQDWVVREAGVQTSEQMSGTVVTRSSVTAGPSHCAHCVPDTTLRCHIYLHFKRSHTETSSAQAPLPMGRARKRVRGVHPSQQCHTETSGEASQPIAHEEMEAAPGQKSTPPPSSEEQQHGHGHFRSMCLEGLSAVSGLVMGYVLYETCMRLLGGL